MARNRKRPAEPRFRFTMPVIDWHRVIGAGVAALVVAAVYVSTVWLMNRPVDAVVISGLFERVSVMQLEEALAPHIRTGFLSADLDAMRADIVATPWVATAHVRRRWPGSIEVSVTEEEPAAAWGEAGLLNMAGELFVTDASHVPAELPRLDGPEGTEARVAELYFRIETRLEQRGLAATALSLDARGAWTFTLTNGVQVRLGASAVEERLERFYIAVDRVLAAEPEQVDYVDMRYTNGFAIGWKTGGPVRAQAAEGQSPNV